MSTQKAELAFPTRYDANGDLRKAPTPQGQPAEHTPGPWEIHTSDDKQFEIHPHGDSDGLLVLADAYTEANAKLIAAAPDMLESLREYVLLETASAPYSASPMRLKAQAAITKALT